MWFEYDGEHVRFTHTNKRGKFRNLQRNPSMSLMVFDPDNPQSYIEVRGRLVEVIDDPAGDSTSASASATAPGQGRHPTTPTA